MKTVTILDILIFILLIVAGAFTSAVLQHHSTSLEELEERAAALEYDLTKLHENMSAILYHQKDINNTVALSLNSVLHILETIKDSVDELDRQRTATNSGKNGPGEVQ